MKITDVKTILLTGPSTGDPFSKGMRTRRSAAFIEIHTDTELIGLGETYAGYFCPEIVPAVVEFYGPVLIGQTVSNISELWNRMYQCGNFWGRVGLGPAVLNGIEAALWDLKGKATGLPVYELLGGRKHDRILCYASGSCCSFPYDRLERMLEYYVSLGFRAVKTAVGNFVEGEGWSLPTSPREAADFEAGKMEFIRSRFGKDLYMMLDGHMGNSVVHTWDLGAAETVVTALEPYDLLFFEEPLHYTDPWGYAELCQATTVPIAGGECLTGTYEWRVFVDQDCFDIGQPDASYTGGLGEFVKVAAMLESRGRKIATHSWGAGGSYMQNLHCGFACANTMILETAPLCGLHGETIIDGAFVMKDGMALPPQHPGLGIVLTEETKRRYPFVSGSGEFNSVPGKVLKD
jgi:L-alanine-DL-glutamate epimerase-like enolase superfamily enzyme